MKGSVTMRKENRLIALVLAAALLMCCLAGCSGNAGKIRDTLEEFEYACRNLDTDAMLGCIDPDVADPIRLILALYSQATEQDYKDVTDEILENIVYSVFGEDFDPDEFLSTMSVSDVELDVDGEVAVVNCVIHFEVAGEQFARDSAIVLVEIRDRWYISYIDLFA
jgi:hypothetical protein